MENQNKLMFKERLKVDVVYPGYLDSNIGPSQTMRRLLKSKLRFEENDIDFNIYYKNKLELISPKSTNEYVVKKKSIFDNVILYTLKNELAILFFVLKYIFKQSKSDIVVFHHVTSFYFYTIFARNNKKILLFQHNEGDLFKMSEVKFPSLKTSRIYSCFKIKVSKKLFKVNRFIFISNYGKKNFNQLYPKYANKSIAIVNGIPDKKYDKIYNPQKIIKLVSVGTVSTRKGQSIIIESLAKLALESKLLFHLTIVGGGPQLQEFKELAKKLNVSDNITFTGPKPPNEVEKYLLLSDIFVLMSHSEGLPLSIIEALRFGLPVITSNVAGCPETVSNNNGFSIPASSSDLSRVLISLEASSLKVMANKSRELFEKDYRFESFVNKYIKLLLNL